MSVANGISFSQAICFRSIIWSEEILLRMFAWEQLLTSWSKIDMMAPMGRPRQFDVEHVLHQCMDVFWTKGFNATSYEDLTRATRVKKQSLYGVFDDKRSLFLRALKQYRKQSIEHMEHLTKNDVSPLKNLEAIRDAILSPVDEAVCRGCLMVNSALEFGTDDEEVTREVDMMFTEMERILEGVIQIGQEQHLLTTDYTSKELAAHLANAILGAKIMEKRGASREKIEAVLRTSFALIAL